MRGAERGASIGRACWVSLGLASVGATTVMLAFRHARSWHYFADAAQLLTAGSGVEGAGLDLYRAHPEFQFGPITVVLAVVLDAVPARLVEWTVMVVGALLGLVALAFLLEVVWQLHPLVRADGRRRALWMAGPLFMVAWLGLSATATHLDDELALTALAAAAAAIGRGRPGWSTVALVVAAAAKPWAIVFAPLALLGGGRRPLARPFVVGVVAAATWVPFLVASPRTLGALREFAVAVDPNSGLRALGLLDASTPGWVRAAQLVLGLAVTTVVALRTKHAPAVIAAGMAARLIIDPATHHYYTAGLVLAALLWELARRPSSFPWRTAVCAAALELTASNLTIGPVVPAVRFLLLGAMITTAMLDTRPHSPASSPTSPASTWPSSASSTAVLDVLSGSPTARTTSGELVPDPSRAPVRR